MSYYFVAQIKMRDEKEYQKYIAGSGEVFKKYHGEYLAVDNRPQVLEGHWDYSRAVLIKFRSRSDFEDWYRSADYQAILKHRLNAADCDTILVEGLN